MTTLAWPAVAAPPGDDAVVPEREDGSGAGPAAAPPRDMSRVWAAIREADAHVDAAEYDEAIALYRDALERLSGDPDWTSQLNTVRRLLASAHVGNYRIHRRLVDLRKAKDLLLVYLGDVAEDVDETKTVQAMIADIDREIAAHGPDPSEAEGGAPKSPPSPDEVPAPVVTRTSGTSGSSERDIVAVAPRRPSPASKRTFTAGVVLSSIGVAGAVPAITGFVLMRRAWGDGQKLVDETPESEYDATEAQRMALEERSEKMATLSLVSTIAGGATLVTGVILLAVGARRSALSTPRSSASAWFDPRGAGLRMSFRF